MNINNNLSPNFTGIRVLPEKSKNAFKVFLKTASQGTPDQIQTGINKFYKD